MIRSPRTSIATNGSLHLCFFGERVFGGLRDPVPPKSHGTDMKQGRTDHFVPCHWVRWSHQIWHCWPHVDPFCSPRHPVPCASSTQAWDQCRANHTPPGVSSRSGCMLECVVTVQPWQAEGPAVAQGVFSGRDFFVRTRPVQPPSLGPQPPSAGHSDRRLVSAFAGKTGVVCHGGRVQPSPFKDKASFKRYASQMRV